MSTSLLLLIAVLGVVLLLLMVIKAKVQPFVALLVVSLLVALASGIPTGEVMKVMTAGMGGVLGSVTIIIGLGAMLGRMIEHSGGAESLAQRFSRAGAETYRRRTDPRRIHSRRSCVLRRRFYHSGADYLWLRQGRQSVAAEVRPADGRRDVDGTRRAAAAPRPGRRRRFAQRRHRLADHHRPRNLYSGRRDRLFRRQLPQPQNYPLSIEVLEQLQLAAPEPRPEGQAPLSDRINPPGAGPVAALIVIPIAIIMLGTVSATLLPAGSALRDTLSLLGSPAVALMIALLLAFYFRRCAAAGACSTPAT